MRIIKYIMILVLCIISGSTYFMVNNKWIIFQIPSAIHNIENQLKNKIANKKTVKLVWYQEKWYEENIELIWSNNKAQNIKYLINSLLNLLDEEKIINIKVLVQSVVLTNSESEAIISFDRNPLDPEFSIFKKLMWAESILKTIRKNEIELQKIQFLVHHQEMIDYHLDFSNPWPIGGFTTIQNH